MDITEPVQTNTPAPAAPTQAPAAPFAPKGNFPMRPRNNFGSKPGERSKNPRRGGSARPERIKPEFDQKILNIRRVTRVTKGGKRMNFSVHVVIGNKKGSVGVGTGKAIDTSAAIDKSVRNAKKNMINLNQRIIPIKV